MTSLPLALYDAFSDTAFGGSQAAVVSGAGSLDDATMARVASELGYPAPCVSLLPQTGNVSRRDSARRSWSSRCAVTAPSPS